MLVRAQAPAASATRSGSRELHRLFRNGPTLALSYLDESPWQARVFSLTSRTDDP
jgi:hypothetical protein